MKRKYIESKIIVEPSAKSKEVPTYVCHLVGTNSRMYTYAMLDFPGVHRPKIKNIAIVRTML
jgi:hypothetical protein